MTTASVTMYKPKRPRGRIGYVRSIEEAQNFQRLLYSTRLIEHVIKVFNTHTHVVDLSKGGCFGKGYIERKQLRGDYSSIVSKSGVQTDKCE